MSGHTLGPWLAEKTVQGAHADRGLGVIAVDADISEIEIRTPTRGIVAWVNGFMRPYTEVLATARLIAAAPEMLSALKMAQVELAPRRSFIDMPSRPGDVQYLRDTIAAAIAKAEGKSS